jgi:CRP-like cAMP-binding protein
MRQGLPKYAKHHSHPKDALDHGTLRLRWCHVQIALVDICRRMVAVSVNANVQLTTEGRLTDGLFVIRLGHVRIMKNGELLGSLGRAELVAPRAKRQEKCPKFWVPEHCKCDSVCAIQVGECSAFGLSPDMRRTVTAITETMCHVLVLPQEDVKNLLEEHTSLYISLQRFMHIHLTSLRSRASKSKVIELKRLYLIPWRDIYAQLQLAEEMESEERAKREASPGDDGEPFSPAKART